MAEIRIAFMHGGNSDGVTREGWAQPEPHGCWTEGHRASLRFTGLFAGVPYGVSINLGPFLVPPQVVAQRLVVSVNGHRCFEDRRTAAGEINFTIPPGVIAQAGQAEMVLECPDAVAPAALGVGGDIRRLGFSVWDVTLEDRPVAVQSSAPPHAAEASMATFVAASAQAAAPPVREVQAPAAAPLIFSPVPIGFPLATPIPEPSPLEFHTAGTCPLCGKATEFVARRATPLHERYYPNWFRDGLRCVSCDSLPRERALFTVVERLYPNWRELAIHECSPSDRGASRRFRQECRAYVETQYDPELGFGKTDPTGRYRSENLEALTFPAASFDLVITQDVFEHLFEPDKAIREIARTLRPGGAHIMTVPIVNDTRPSARRAKRTEQGVEMLTAPQYHGNPVSSKGSLVTIDWGYDIVDYLASHSGLAVSMYYFDDLSRGMRAVCMEVIACRKMGMPPKL